MAEYPEDFELSLLNMPKEILIIIINMLPTLDHKNIALTCMDLFCLINDLYLKNRYLNLSGHLDFSPNGRLYQTFQCSFPMWSFEKIKICNTDFFQEDGFRFLDLCGDRIKHLEIHFITKEFNQNYLQYFPNVESIFIRAVIDYVTLFEFQTVPRNLKKIEINYLESLEAIKKEMPLKIGKNMVGITIQCNEIQLNKLIVVEETRWFSPSLKCTLLEIIDEDLYFETKYNFNGTTLMDYNDITCIHSHLNEKTFDNLAKFENLKEIAITASYNDTICIPTQLPAFPNLTSLGIWAELTSDQLSTLLKHLTGLKTLKLGYATLEDADFHSICELQPSLKYLEIDNINVAISSEVLTHEQKPSLKDLTQLEELEITVNAKKYVLIHDTGKISSRLGTVQWPCLPSLNTLHLEFYGYKELDDELQKISKNFPSIVNLTFPSYEHPMRNELLTILKGWPNQLTSLCITEEGVCADWFTENRSTVLDTLIEKGNRLKKIELKFRQRCMTIQDMCKLFQNILALKRLILRNHVTKSEHPYNCIVMTRYNYKNLKGFLKTNLKWFLYELADSTLLFVIKELMEVPNYLEVLNNRSDALMKVLTYLGFSSEEISEIFAKMIPSNTDHDLAAN